MSDLTQACTACRSGVEAVFGPGGTRAAVTINGPVFVVDQCFVADVITFDTGQLIFSPDPKTKEGQRGGYQTAYYVICRKLIVVGGTKPGSLNPCGPDDPGKTYDGNNVITWLGRLTTGKDGPSFVTAADDGESFTGSWQDLGQGDDGKDGGNGANGATGNQGEDESNRTTKFSPLDPPFNAPATITLIALEVEIGVGDHLTIDANGRDGGKGGRGQRGGTGGHGMRGRTGQSDTSWPGTGCDREPGNGGDGGDGGTGGPGGDGGRGGDAKDIIIISTHDNVQPGGTFHSGHFSYINDGGQGGVGGLTGLGGLPGAAGKAGIPTSECSSASDGDPGDHGAPETLPLPGSDPTQGATGAHGTAGTTKYEEVERGTCADRLPLDVVVDPSKLQPATYCRGFSTPATGDGTITGQNLLQVTGADVSQANVHVTKKGSSDDTHLNLKFDIDGNSGLGLGDITLHRGFGGDVTLAGAITINRFDVTGVAPNAGAKGANVNVTITGACFDFNAPVQNVDVSGVGVTVVNVVVVDSHTITCTFQIGSGALVPTGPRSITVTMGSLGQLFIRTLVDGFTVT